MDKYRNQYRTTSARLQNWDYGWNGAYFITLCCKNQIHYFGEISEGKMQLSARGVIADVLWYEIKNHAKNHQCSLILAYPGTNRAMSAHIRSTRDIPVMIAF